MFSPNEVFFHVNVCQTTIINVFLDACSAETSNEIITHGINRFESHGQNPISALNEMKLNEKYEIADIKGPHHQLVFTYRVKVAGQCFYGTGYTKKDAKTATAREALRHLDNFIQKSYNIRRPENGVILSRSAGKYKLLF